MAGASVLAWACCGSRPTLSADRRCYPVANQFFSVNPATGALLRQFDSHSRAEVEAKLVRANLAFQDWRRKSFSERAAATVRVADILEAEKAAFARMMTLEMGKPIRAAVQEVEKCAANCRFYAVEAERFLLDEPLLGVASTSFVRYQPLGPILAVMPWNFPFWQVLRFAAPALMAGNVALLKHASNVPQCALALEELFRRAGFPVGAFQTLLIGSNRVEELIADPRVKAATLTGSLGAGESVAATAGRHIKKTVLELGGSDPFIVMPSADLTQAVATAVQARTINNGQSCIAAKRFLLHESIAAEFERLFTARMAALRVGDPLDEQTEIGPLATAEARDGLAKQVDQSVRQGARVLLGGHLPAGPGFFYPPSVLTNAPPESPARREELFGPVATLISVGSLTEALEVANETSFGLGACLWTSEKSEREMFIDEIEAGLAFVNGMVASHPALPFGGVKQSGYGRELSAHGIREFVNIKTISISSGSLTRNTPE